MAQRPGVDIPRPRWRTVAGEVEREMGFEPTTACLEGRNSTTELLPLGNEHTNTRSCSSTFVLLGWTCHAWTRPPGNDVRLSGRRRPPAMRQHTGLGEEAHLLVTEAPVARPPMQQDDLGTVAIQGTGILTPSVVMWPSTMTGYLRSRQRTIGGTFGVRTPPAISCRSKYSRSSALPPGERTAPWPMASAP